MLEAVVRARPVGRILALSGLGLFLSVTGSMSTGNAKPSPPECAALAQERKKAFADHQSALKLVGRFRSWAGEISTVDPALIDMRLNQTSSLITSLRQRLTPDEQKSSKSFATAEDAYEFWQAKKAHETTGGMVDVPTPRLYLAYLKAQLKEAETKEKATSAQIATLDEKMKDCKAASGRGTATSSAWGGDWSDGTGGTVLITVSGDAFSFNYEVEGKPFSQGRCTFRGNTAACQWSQQVAETHNGAQVTRMTSGHGSMTLSASQIRVHFVTDTLNFNPSCPIFDCGPPKPGFVSDFGLIRKR